MIMIRHNMIIYSLNSSNTTLSLVGFEIWSLSQTGIAQKSLKVLMQNLIFVLLK